MHIISVYLPPTRDEMQAAPTILKGEQSSLVQSTRYLHDKIISMCYYYITHYLISQRVCQKDPSGDTAKRYRQTGNLISGGEPATLLQYELHSLGEEERYQLLKDGGITQKCWP